MPSVSSTKILIKCPNWVGDAILITPALRALRERFPQAHIAAVARPWVAPLMRTNPDLNAVWEESPRSDWAGFWQLARRLRAEQFDLGIAFANSFAAALLLWAGRVRRRIGYARDNRSLLLTDRVRVRPELLCDHEVKYHFHLLSALGGVPETMPPLVLEEDAAAREKVARVLSEQGISPETPLAGLNPLAFYGSAKRWPPSRFAAVGKRLAEALNGIAYVAGTASEKAAAQEVCDAVGARARNLSGLFNLPELVSLIKRSEIFVTNDSGAMHIAAALGVRTVAIFGATDWVKTSPWSGNAIVVRRETACAPCMLRACPIDHRCMRRVQVNDVLDAIRRRWPELALSG
ncbi:MAG: lipopolysaccharide heptosyltransferase II [Candidatus Sumerlaeia bacterium]|nr:lipopolysaccharide heptosyltransferase II [Candidatus Sumerlaeia bacterium]